MENICDGSLEEIERYALIEPVDGDNLSRIAEYIKRVDPDLFQARALARKYIGTK